jgi:translation initiation factor IF-3
MSVERAIPFVNQFGKDLVLHNPKVEPMLCKAINYRQHLYSRFIEEVIKKDILMKKKYEKKRELKIEREKLRPNITKNDLQIKFQKTLKRLPKVNQVLVVMRVKGNLIDQGMAVFNNYQNISKKYLKPLNKITIRSSENDDFDEDNIILDEAEQATYDDLDNEYDDFEITKDDHIHKRNINREELYFLLQAFEPVGIEQVQTESLDANFSENELKDLVREYFNISRRGLKTQRRSLVDEAREANIQATTSREEALESEILKQKKLKVGKEGVSPQKDIEEILSGIKKLHIEPTPEERKKQRDLKSKEEIVKHLNNLEDLDEKSEIDELYEEMRYNYRINKGPEKSDIALKKFFQEKSQTNLSIIEKLLG